MNAAVITPQEDWRAYTVPWDTAPAPPWDLPSPPTGWVGAWPPYSSITMYFTTHWPNATVPAGTFDPFLGWTAQDKDDMGNWVMRPHVPGLTSP